MNTKRPNVKKTLLEHIAFASFRPERHAHLLLEEDLPPYPPDLDWVKRNYYRPRRTDTYRNEARGDA